MPTLAEVFLIVTIITADKPPMQHMVPMPDVETCLKEAAEFLNHEFPETLNATQVGALCKGSIPKRQSS